MKWHITLAIINIAVLKTFAQITMLDTVTIYYKKSKGSDIAVQPYRSLNTTLSMIPSLWLVARQPDLIQADLNLHGHTFESSRLRFGNIEFYDPQTGHHNMNIPAGRTSFEITAWESETPQVRFRKQRAVLTETQFVQWGNETSLATYNEITSRELNAGFSLSKFFKHFFIRLSPDSASWIGFRHNSFDATGMYAPASILPYAYEQTSVLMTYFHKGNLEGIFRLHSDQFQYLYASSRGDTFALSNSHFTWLSISRYEHPISFGTLLFNFTVDGISNNKVYDATGNHFVYRLIPMAGLRGQIKSWHWKATIQWNATSNYLLPDIEISHKGNIYLSAGYNGRYPSYNELFYSDPVNKPDTTRVPEQWLFLYAGIMKNRYSAIVLGRYFITLRDWIKTSDGTTWQAGAISNVGFVGVEALWKFKPWFHASLSAYKFFLTDSMLARMKYVGRTPLVKFGIVTTWASLLFVYQPLIEHMKQMVLLDIHIPLKWRQWLFAFGVRNALNQYVATPWQQPQRTWFISVTYHPEKK